MAKDEAEILFETVRTKLPGVDAATQSIVAAIAGLLAAVAYADRRITTEESAQLGVELRRIHGMTEPGAVAILEVLHAHALRFSTAFSTRFTRILREAGDRELCLEVLGVLVDLAAVDGAISLNEVTSLRTLATGLGLSQHDYNDLQAKHRDKLSFL